jgi:hypothetical protein
VVGGERKRRASLAAVPPSQPIDLLLSFWNFNLRSFPRASRSASLAQQTSWLMQKSRQPPCTWLAGRPAEWLRSKLTTREKLRSDLLRSDSYSWGSDSASQVA